MIPFNPVITVDTLETDVAVPTSIAETALAEVERLKRTVADRDAYIRLLELRETVRRQGRRR